MKRDKNGRQGLLTQKTDHKKKQDKEMRGKRSEEDSATNHNPSDQGKCNIQVTLYTVLTKLLNESHSSPADQCLSGIASTSSFQG